jgi:hypothetical protein
MKLQTSAMLAGVLVAATVAVTAGDARADAFYYYSYGPGPWYPGANIAAFGMGIGNFIAPMPFNTPFPPPPPPVSAYSPGYSSDHILWCEGRYPNSYDPVSNSWVDFGGYRRTCISPYLY